MSKTADYADVLELGQEPARYDTEIWAERQSMYNAWYNYWSGEVLDEEDSYAVLKERDKKPLLYPLKLNLIQMTCLLHAGGLLGQTDGRDLPIDLTAKPRADRGGKAAAETATSVFSDYLEASGFESTVDEQAICAMVFGGAYYKTSFDPGAEMGVRAEAIWPEWIRPVWHPFDYNRLIEVFVIYKTSEANAEHSYNVSLKKGDKIEGNKVRVVEHWSEKNYEVRVGGQQAKYSDGTPMKGENPFGFVPFVYLPRYRAGSFYGESLIDPLTGIQDEINLRLADVGDATSDTAHQQVWVKNRQKGNKGLRMNPHDIWNLGLNPSGPEPEVGVLPAPVVPPSVMVFVESLFNVFRQLAHTPPVVYGIDEGSQRSALTLAFRMFPFTQMIYRYRRSWSYPLKQMAYQALSVMAAKGLNGVTDVHKRQIWSIGWAPVIPRDREQLVNETILLVQTMLRSPEKALTMLGDIPKEEISEELERIKKYHEWRSMIQRPEPGAGGGAGEGPIIKTEAPVAKALGD